MIASRFERWLGILCAFVLAGIHLYLAPGRYSAEVYVGALFIFGALALLSAAMTLGVENWPRLIPLQRFSWASGAFTCAAMLGFFLVSRTAGLPGYPSGKFYDGGTAWPAVAIVSIVAEVVYLLAFASSIARGEMSHPHVGPHPRREPDPDHPLPAGGVMPVAGWSPPRRR
jgi:hypothetical protein